jgi:hypothetical protein
VATATGYVAGGVSHHAGPGPYRPAAWTSTDGLSWRRADQGLDFDGDLLSITDGAAGIVAGGTFCSTQDCYGTSAVLGTDGSWAVPPSNGHGLGPLRRVVSAGVDGYFGLTWDGDQKLWRSQDGLSWEPVEGLPPDASPRTIDAADLVAADGRVVIAGWAGNIADASAASFALSGPA